MPPISQLPTKKKRRVQGHCIKKPNSAKKYIFATEGTVKTKDICPQTFLHQQKLFNKYFFIHIYLTSKGHECLTSHHMGYTKTRPCLQQDIKCLLCLHEKLAIITHPSQNTLLNKKIRYIIQMPTWEQSSTFAFRHIHIIYLHHHLRH